MNRVVINMDAQGCWTVYSDEPIEFFCVNDHCPDDRVYEMDVEIGVEKVRQQLGNDPVGHKFDSQTLGAGYGPRKPPARRKLEVVEKSAPKDNMPCPCTTFEQDEDCPVGFPSLLCSACKGTGSAPVETVVALAAEMMKVAEQVDELEDPFAAWETIDLIKSQHGQLRRALVDMLPPDLPWKRDADGVLIHHKVAAINVARAVLATTEGSTDAN